MKITKQRIKEIIQEEFETMNTSPVRRRVLEGELADLQPAVDEMVSQIDKAAEGASKNYDNPDATKNMLLAAVIQALQGLVG